jgi:hypothetical protein
MVLVRLSKTDLILVLIVLGVVAVVVVVGMVLADDVVVVDVV